MLAVDTVLENRYRIVRLLGQGGMGAVYEAIDERFGTPVALKEILIELANVASEKNRDLVIKAFEREAKSLANARHEAVPFVRDYFSEAGSQFLVMELVEGEELGDLLIKRKKPFPLADVLNWLDQLLDALDYLHTLSPPIIHRDIKPQNLKLTQRGKIKLLDFGIAKSIDDSASTITNQTFVAATLNYSPIEQILRVIDPTFREFIVLNHKEEAERVLNQTTDLRCDIYALGATFYHFLTNHPPIDAPKRSVAVWSGKKDPLPNPSELNPKIPQLVSEYLLKAMRVERDERFSSALEMREALETAIAIKETGATDRAQSLNDDEEQISHQQRLMQAKTDNILEAELKNLKSVGEDSAAKPSAEAASYKEPADTQPSESEDPITDSSFEEMNDTNPSGIISEPEMTEPSYLDGVLPAKVETTPQSLSAVQTDFEADSNESAKLYRILPIFAFAIFVISGVGGIIWMTSSPSLESDQPAVNTNFIVPTPTDVPVGTQTLDSTNQNLDQTNVSNSATASSSPSDEPLPSPTRNRATKSKNRKTSATPKRSRKPNVTPKKKRQTQKKPRPTQDPNCVFTNSCQ